MSVSTESSIYRVRQMLQRFATPHPVLRLLTTEVEARVAALTPNLPLLEAAPFGGLAASEAPEYPQRTAATAPRRRSSRAPEPKERLTRSASTAGAPGAGVSASLRNARTLEPVAAGAVPKSRAPTPGQSAAHSPKDYDAGKTTALNPPPSNTPLREFIVSVGKRSARGEVGLAANPDARAALPSPTDADAMREGGTVDVGALAQRVMQKQKNPGNASGQAARAGVGFTSDRSDPVRPDSRGADPREPDRRIVLPLSQHAPDPPLLSAPQKRQNTRRAARPAQATPAPGAHSGPQAAAPAPDAVVRNAPAFVFDPFEERASAENSDFSLTQRIDQILREQARRQGVDLS